MGVVLSLGTSYTLCHWKAWPLPTWADPVASTRDVLSSVLHSTHMLRRDITLRGQDLPGLGDTAKGQSQHSRKKLPDTGGRVLPACHHPGGRC